jgi:hypothetical protein
MQKSLVRRVERLEVAKCALHEPHVVVIPLDEHGRPPGPLPQRSDGLAIPVILLPALRTPAFEDFQIMATPKELRQRRQH